MTAAKILSTAYNKIATKKSHKKHNRLNRFKKTHKEGAQFNALMLKMSSINRNLNKIERVELNITQ